MVKTAKIGKPVRISKSSYGAAKLGAQLSAKGLEELAVAHVLPDSSARSLKSGGTKPWDQSPLSPWPIILKDPVGVGNGLYCQIN